MTDASPNPTRGEFRRFLLFWTVPSICVAALMMYVAWQHNPQDEFHGDAGIEWRAWLGLGLIWFLGVWLPGLLLVGGIRLAGKLIQRQPSDPPPG